MESGKPSWAIVSASGGLGGYLTGELLIENRKIKVQSKRFIESVPMYPPSRSLGGHFLKAGTGLGRLQAPNFGVRILKPQNILLRLFVGYHLPLVILNLALKYHLHMVANALG